MSQKKLKKITKPSEGIPSAWNEVVDSAFLDDVKLISSNFTIKPNFFDPELPKKLIYEHKVEDVHYGPDSDFGYVLMQFCVKAKKGNSNLLVAGANYLVSYSFSKKVDEVQVVNFLRKVGRNTAYPYFRRHLSGLSNEAGAELPILPVLKQAPANQGQARGSNEGRKQLMEI